MIDHKHVIIFLTVWSVLSTALCIHLIKIFVLRPAKKEGEFAEWAQLNDFYYSRKNKWWTNPFDAYDKEHNRITYTTDQLYAIWKKG